jgi:hypothetical protein
MRFSRFGLVHPREGTIGGVDWSEVPWLDSQRLPHNDVRWDIPCHADGRVPTSYASVLPLTKAFNRSGTGLWVEAATQTSLLQTVAMNNAAQGNMNPHNPAHLRPDLDLLAEIDPPHAVLSHAWAACALVAELRFNRYVFYDGRRLHQQYCSPEDAARLSKDPTQGRLTMNSFFWAGP